MKKRNGDSRHKAEVRYVNVTINKKKFQKRVRECFLERSEKENDTNRNIRKHQNAKNMGQSRNYVNEVK